MLKELVSLMDTLALDKAGKKKKKKDSYGQPELIGTQRLDLVWLNMEF